MPGETDLEAMLATLTVSRRDGVYTVVSLDSVLLESGQVPPIGGGVEMVLREAEGVTVVCTLAQAQRSGWSGDFEAAWLTLDVHSSLEAVGLTAAFSTALGKAGVACNVLAGCYHDHLLVPVAQAADAIRCLEALRASR